MKSSSVIKDSDFSGRGFHSLLFVCAEPAPGDICHSLPLLCLKNKPLFDLVSPFPYVNAGLLIPYSRKEK